MLETSDYNIMKALENIEWQLINRLIHQQFSTVKSIPSDELADWLNRSPTPLLLDTRTEEEFAVSHLQNAQRLDPQTKDFSQIGQVDRPIVTYCSVGYRSARIAQRLQAAGYQNVWNLKGSIFQWANEGKPVYQGDRLVQKVHPYDAFWGILLDRRYHP